MPPSSPNLPLFLDPAACPGAPVRADHHPSPQPDLQERLWLCLHLPWLPLEACGGTAGDVPRAVLAGEQRRPAILLCNEAAAGCGVKPGMPVNAALALSPGLEIARRDPGRERGTLHELAAGALRFTPLVSLDADDGLLLEIAASQALFGGAAALRAAALGQVRSQGRRVAAAVAPTARAAAWLARCGQEALVTDPASLPGVLGRLPLRALGWPRPVLESLRRIGVSRLGECMRLPRDGLARRLGESCLLEIDEALGRRPEVRPAWRPAARFHAGLELPAETRETGAILEALRILLGNLREHLRARQSGARVLWTRLRHARLPASLVRIGLLRPSADMSHLEELAAIHLSVARIPAPVVAITLEADVADLGRPGGGDLLGLRNDPGEQMAGLVERLRMRFGPQAVHGLSPWQEHRPEHAWRAIPDPGAVPPGRIAAGDGQRRPLWILDQPLPLGEQAGVPVFHGRLVLEQGPERIETGWWDGGDVRRDYYVACNPRGARAWVFRERRSGRWYLHGLFG